MWENRAIMSYGYPESTCYIFRFIDHLMVMFGETPCWDLEQKYCPDNLEVREVLLCSSMGFFWLGGKVSLPLKKNCGKIYRA